MLKIKTIPNMAFLCFLTSIINVEDVVLGKSYDRRKQRIRERTEFWTSQLKGLL